MAAKFFTGLPLDGPDPECARGHGESALAAVAPGSAPRSTEDHTRGRRTGGPLPVAIGRRPPEHACDESPLAGFDAGVS
jgi:hypothetical protein